MIKVLVDTNFLLDVMVSDRPFSSDSLRLFALMDDGVFDIGLCAGSLKDCYYIARRYMSEEDRRLWLHVFLERMDVFPVDTVLCGAALASDEPDFEDGLIRACAEWWNADYILSRDAAAFVNSSVPRVESPQLLRLLGD